MSVTNITSTSASISYSYTNNVPNLNVVYWSLIVGGVVRTTRGVADGVTVTGTVQVSGLSPNTTYSVNFEIRNALNVLLQSGAFINPFTTLGDTVAPPPSTTPPPAPPPPPPPVGGQADPGYSGTGGGGAGGTAADVDRVAGGGGGVGLLGLNIGNKIVVEANSGITWYTRNNNIVLPALTSGVQGQNGSPRNGGNLTSGNGALYGGGGGGADSSAVGAGSGAQGAVRILWAKGRAFPNANASLISSFPKATPVGPSLLNFTTPGLYEFEVPAGITRINVLAIGGGGGANNGNILTSLPSSGGGGGALAYGNNIVVTPGETLQISVGARGSIASVQTSGQGGTGGTSRVTRLATEEGDVNVDLVVAGGGQGGRTRTAVPLSGVVSTLSGGAGGTASGTALSAGFTGGPGGRVPGGQVGTVRTWGGAAGGGAAGYLGSGGAGADAGRNFLWYGGLPGSSAAPNSQGGGGGGSGVLGRGGAGGGGVGLPYLIDANSGVLVRNSTTGAGGNVGSGGFGGALGGRGGFSSVTNGSLRGGNYGGGAGAAHGNAQGLNLQTEGGSGAVQIAFGGVAFYPGQPDNVAVPVVQPTNVTITDPF